MHELSLLLALADQVQREAQRHGSPRVLVVELRIGRLAGVDAAALAFAFPLAMAGTVAAAARLRITWLPALARCRACDRRYRVPHGVGPCPRCHRGGAELLQGRELHLHRLTLGP